MSLFKQDPLDAEIKRLEREQRELEREAARLSSRGFETPKPEEPQKPVPRPAKILFENEDEIVEPGLSVKDRRMLKVQQKIARNRVITLGLVLLVLAILAARSVGWIP